GRAGPAAVSFSAFKRYYGEEAWTWELTALAKARAVAGDPALAARVETAIDAVLAAPRDAGALARDIDAMRARLTAAKPGAGLWDVKYGPGGLTDVEFVVQYAQLRAGRRFDWRTAGEIGDPTTDFNELLSANDLLERVLSVARAATGGVVDAERAGLALQRRISEACDANSLEDAREAVARARRTVVGAYEATIGAAARGTVDPLTNDPA
ncbi:MAG: hypothetical protein AAGC56_14815, partial [Pseudomonadota bacterium]